MNIAMIDTQKDPIDCDPLSLEIPNLRSFSYLPYFKNVIHQKNLIQHLSNNPLHMAILVHLETQGTDNLII